MSKLTLNDVLDVKHLGEYAWSPDSKTLAFLWSEIGKSDLWLVDVATGDKCKLTTSGEVTEFAWHPQERRLAMVQEGNVWEIDVEGKEPNFKELTRTRGTAHSLRYSPPGDILAYFRDGTLWFHYQDGLAHQIHLGDKEAQSYTSAPLEWSPDGKLVAYSLFGPTKKWETGVLDRDGELVYKVHDLEQVVKPTWVKKDVFIYQVIRRHNLHRDYWLVDLSCSEKRLLHQDISTERGPLLFTGVFPAPDGEKLLYLLETDGWAHLYLQNQEGGPLKQLTAGEWEDAGHIGDVPRWLGDSRHAVYASSRGALAQRQLWLLDTETGESRQLTDFPGNNVSGKPSPCGRWVAFNHADPWRCADLWLLDLENPKELKQLTHSFSDAWTRDVMSVPEEVSFPSNGGLTVHGMLFKPQDFDENRQYPALVWIHGGPILQMRWGWHYLAPYALMYAFHQYLAEQGYVSLFVNFRGGSGYGREFRHGLYQAIGVDDVADVVNAGRYLKSLPYVDEDHVGIWGRSYGGWLTLHALTQYPDEFCLGINVAGIWDWTKAHYWALERRGVYGEQLTPYVGGEPDQSPEMHRQASPSSFCENMKAPLVNLHGTSDVNVDIGQLDRIVEDCVRWGKNFEAHYYPKEVHMFSKRETWVDAYKRVEAALKRYMPVE